MIRGERIRHRKTFVMVSPVRSTGQFSYIQLLRYECFFAKVDRTKCTFYGGIKGVMRT